MSVFTIKRTTLASPMAADDFEIICVCRACGFPFGDADTPRIIAMGEALQAVGVPFFVLHWGPTRHTLNAQKRGVHRGIRFEYTGGPVHRPTARLLTYLLYAYGFCQLGTKLVRLRSSHRCIYLFMQEGLGAVLTALLCRLLGYTIIQELNEWFPERSKCSAITRWFYQRGIYIFATGALVISTDIERRVRLSPRFRKHSLIIHKTPILNRIDPDFAVSHGSHPVTACFTWAGYVDGYSKDILFLVECLSMTRYSSPPPSLTITGHYSPQVERDIRTHVLHAGLDPARVTLAGYLDEGELRRRLSFSAALLLPMWDDDKSRTRFPTKLSFYLASGRPVIAGAVGEVAEFLKNGESALLCKPGDIGEFAACMDLVLESPNVASAIGAAGRSVASKEFDLSVHAARLKHFFLRCLERRRS
jgi:glycosyltransferase involved in cell wall biosynthesis